MTLSINCKDAGDPVCTHTMYGETEEELLKNAKEHGIKEHGYTEETWNEKMLRIQEKFKTLINHPKIFHKLHKHTPPQIGCSNQPLAKYFFDCCNPIFPL